MAGFAGLLAINRHFSGENERLRFFARFHQLPMEHRDIEPLFHALR
jgi:hypothetical protein